MELLPSISASICQLSLLGLLVTSVLLAVRTCRERPGSWRPGLRLFLPPLGLGLAFRLLAPWGPHIASGRDLNHIDEIIAGAANAHVDMLASTYFYLPSLQDPLAALEWGQVVLGAASCGLVALLTWRLVGRELPALFSGLLAAVVVALARVDASPNPMVPMRFFLLLALIHAAGYRARRRDWLSLLAVTLGLVAISYGRLESVLLAALALVWLAMDPDESAEPGSGMAALGACLCLTMFGALVSRWLLLPGAALSAFFLWRRNRRRLAPLPVLGAGLATCLLLLPRLIEIFLHERETFSRFPVAFLYLFGRANILVFGPELCTPFVLLFLIAGWRASRRDGLVLRRYLICVALPAFALYLLFMGDTSARLKLQGTGILLLLPLAGVGAEWIVDRLNRLKSAGVLAWGLATGVLVAAISLLLGWSTLRTTTTIQREYGFLRSLADRLPPGTTVHTLPPGEKTTLIRIPEAIQKEAGFRAVAIQDPLDPRLEPGALVYLSAGCHRFRDGSRLPGVGTDLVLYLLESGEWSGPRIWLGLAWNKQALLEEVFDSIEPGARAVCRSLQEKLALVPFLTGTAERTPLEGRWMPRRFGFGLYRVTRDSR